MVSVSIYKDPKELKEMEYSRKLFPKLEGDQYELLKEDVAKHGIRTPLVITSDNVIICGHERTRVALELGLKRVPVEIFEGDELDQQEYLIVENLARKSVDTATKIKAYLELERIYGLKRAGRPEIRSEDRIITTDEIAKKTGISRETVGRFKKIQDSDLPERIKQAVSDYEIPIRPIAELASQPKDVRDKVSKIIMGKLEEPSERKGPLPVAPIIKEVCGVPPTPPISNEKINIAVEAPKDNTYPTCCPRCLFYQYCKGGE